MDYGWQTIEGTVPSKANDYRIVKFGNKMGVAKDPKVKEFENSFYMQCGKYRDLNIDGYFEYYADVYYSTMRPDIDNSLKVQLDCLQHCHAIKNDNKCVKVVARKFVDKQRPRLEFKIITIE